MTVARRIRHPCSQESSRAATESPPFLGILGDDGLRKKLEGLTPDTMAKDPLFPESRAIGDRFQRGLSQLFFDTDRRLTDAVLRYGVF
jgi:hypothetical protein